MAAVKATRFLLLVATALTLSELELCVATPLSDTGVAVSNRYNYTLQFVLLTNTTAECVDSVGSNVSVELSYRTPGGEWTTLDWFTRLPGAGGCDADDIQNAEEVPLPQSVIDEGAVQFRWRQSGETWGLCNCWQIDDVIVVNASNQFVGFSSFGDSGAANGLDSGFVCTEYGASADQLSSCLNANDGLVLCYGSASVPRGVVTAMFQLLREDVGSDSCTGSDLFDPISDVQLCDGMGDPFIKVSFQLTFNDNHELTFNDNHEETDLERSCDKLESFDEGVELAIRRSEDEQWVPLKFYTLSSLTMDRDVRIDIGSYDQNSSVVSLRGYNVSVMLHNFSVMNVTEFICDERFFQEEVQFRWLQTVTRDDNPVRDTWFIDNVEVSFHEGQDSARIEFFDGFSNNVNTSINTTLWPQVRGGQLGGAGTGVGTACVPEDGIVLFFGANEEMSNVVTRLAVIKPLDLRQATAPATGTSSTAEFTSVIVPGSTGSDDVMQSSATTFSSSTTSTSLPPIHLTTVFSSSTSIAFASSPITSTSAFSSTTAPTTVLSTAVLLLILLPSSATVLSSSTTSSISLSVASTLPLIQSTAGFSSSVVLTSPTPSSAAFSSNVVPSSFLPIATAVFSSNVVPSSFLPIATAVFSSNVVPSSSAPDTTAVFSSNVVPSSFLPIATAVFSSNVVPSSSAPDTTAVFSSNVVPSSFLPIATAVFSSNVVLSSSAPDTTAVFSSNVVPSSFLPIATAVFSSNVVPSSSAPDTTAVFSSNVVLSSSTPDTTAVFSSNVVPSSSTPDTTAVFSSATILSITPSSIAAAVSSAVGVASTPTPTPTPGAPSVAVQVLMDLFNDTEEVPPSEILVTLGSVLRNLPSGITFPPEVSEQLFSSVSDLIDTAQQMDNNGDGSTDIGSTLVDLMDRFALGPYDPEQGELEDTDNIALVHMVQSTSGGDPVEGISRNGNRIVLPGEVFMNVNRPEVPVASYYYRNMSGLLPDSIPGDSQNSTTNTRLASPILSSALQCGFTRCNTRDLNLTNPVVLVFRHSPELVDDLGQQDGRESSVICVFLNLNDSSANGLISGQWATEGCTRNDRASNKSQTVCECNHLTHFALLLSTREISLTSAEALSLRIIGVICVAISLTCLTATILVYLSLKPLWSMRNYIHVNLCASLFIAQLIFIVAVEPHGSVIGCQAVAVLLHYFFLVTFMWMLMEGVVLYVALVKVFIKFKNRYLIAFTLASYGIPLLYLGITVPLGFALDNGPHYAGDDPQSCWLRYDTHFIWAFIAPVIVIILANIGFFIMAITIMYRHQRRAQKNKVATLKHWLKTSISLVIVMGITWIIGILVFNRDLLFVAYIYTIFIGLQGLVIFVLFVVLSKQVREAYTKWWKVKVVSSDFLSRHFGEKSYASNTGMMAVGSTLNKNTLSMDKSKSLSRTLGTSIPASPTPTNNNHIESVGNGIAEVKEVEVSLDTIVNDSAIELEEERQQDAKGNGEIGTLESDSSEPEVTAL